MRFGELFAGIGGFSLGLERAGMKCAWQVEIDPYATAVLNKHWPNVRRHDDVRTFPPTHTHTHRISASISSAAASPAKTSASLAREQDSQARGPVFGTILLGSFAQFGPDGWSSKTSQLSLLEGSEPFSETWPKSGLMRNGIAYRLQPLVRRTGGSESGLWATPSATDGQGGGTITDAMTGVSLTQMVNTPHRWPTPVANQQAAASIPALLNEAARLHPRGQWTLATQVAAEHVHGNRMWPTPTVQDASNNGGPSQYERNSLPLNAVAGGSLNPTWVEWLMGFPLGWTALDASETPSSRKSSKSSGGRSLQQKRG
jgi:site-specific DNA-cytosine methylase